MLLLLLLLLLEAAVGPIGVATWQRVTDGSRGSRVAAGWQHRRHKEGVLGRRQSCGLGLGLGLRVAVQDDLEKDHRVQAGACKGGPPGPVVIHGRDQGGNSGP